MGSPGIVLAYVNSVVPFLWHVIRAAIRKWGHIEFNFYAAGQFRRSDGSGLPVDMPMLMLEFMFDGAGPEAGHKQHLQQKLLQCCRQSFKDEAGNVWKLEKIVCSKFALSQRGSKHKH